MSLSLSKTHLMIETPEGLVPHLKTHFYQKQLGEGKGSVPRVVYPFKRKQII